MKLLVSVLIVACVSVLSFSQTKSKADLEVNIKTFNNRKHYQIKYDKFKDVTLVLARAFKVASGTTGFLTYRAIYCGAGFEFKGQTLSQSPSEFGLIFDVLTGSRQSMFNGAPDAILLADEHRIVLGTGIKETERQSNIFMSSLSSTGETIFYSINEKDFEKITKAKVVEIQLGSAEYKLKPDILEMFKNLFRLSRTA